MANNRVYLLIIPSETGSVDFIPYSYEYAHILQYCRLRGLVDECIREFSEEEFNTLKSLPTEDGMEKLSEVIMISDGVYATIEDMEMVDERLDELCFAIKRFTRDLIRILPYLKGKSAKKALKSLKEFRKDNHGLAWEDYTMLYDMFDEPKLVKKILKEFYSRKKKQKLKEVIKDYDECEVPF